MRLHYTHCTCRFDVMRSSTSDGLDSTSGSSLDTSEPRAFAPSKPNSAASQQQPGAQSGPHTSVMVAGGSGGSGQEGQRLLDSAGGGASGGVAGQWPWSSQG